MRLFHDPKINAHDFSQQLFLHITAKVSTLSTVLAEYYLNKAKFGEQLRRRVTIYDENDKSNSEKSELKSKCKKLAEVGEMRKPKSERA